MFVARSHADAHVSPAEVRAYVKKHVGGQSAPAWVWFLGEEGVPTEFPKTASGKIQKVRTRVPSLDPKRADPTRREPLRLTI